MRQKWYKRIMLASVVALLAGCGETGDSQEEATEKESIFSLDSGDLNYDKREEYSSDEEYPELASFLIDYYQIPKEYLPETRYYYNFTDLNEDGTEEIVTLTIGETTTSSDGECILALEKSGSAFQVIGDFRNARTPVLICDAKTNGWHEMAYPVYGGMQETGYQKCSYQEGQGYQSGEEDFLEEVDAQAGLWILSDNLINDWDQGDYLTLGGRG